MCLFYAVGYNLLLSPCWRLDYTSLLQSSFRSVPVSFRHARHTVLLVPLGSSGVFPAHPTPTWVSTDLHSLK